MDACRNEELLTQLNWRAPLRVTPNTAALPSPIRDRFTLVQSTLATPADFLLLSWLACHLQAGEHVVLLHTARSRLHYQHAGRKWNVNVAAAEAAGQLSLVDAYAPLHTVDLTRPLAPHTALLTAVQAATRPPHVAIDGLTLLALTTEPADLHAFLSRLRCLAASVLLVAPSDVPSQRPLQCALSQWADCVLSLSPLRTGASREVDGVLEAVKRDVETGVDSSRTLLFYRLQANGVQLSGRGTQT